MWHDVPRMTSAGTQWLVAQFRGRQLRVGPAGELRSAEAALDAAESRGDQQAIDEANAELDRLFSEARGRTEDAKRESSAAMRFSSGPRKPIVKRPTPNAQMDAAILRASGRSR